MWRITHILNIVLKIAFLKDFCYKVPDNQRAIVRRRMQKEKIRELLLIFFRLQVF